MISLDYSKPLSLPVLHVKHAPIQCMIWTEEYTHTRFVQPSKKPTDEHDAYLWSAFNGENQLGVRAFKIDIITNPVFDKGVGFILLEQ